MAFGLKYDNIENYLKSYGKYIVRQAKGILRQKGKDSSGTLINSLDYKVVKDKDGFDIDFYAAEYAKFVAKGVSGRNVTRSYIDMKGKRQTSPYRFKSKTIKTSVLDKWIIRKGLVPRTSGGQFKKRSVNAVGFRKSLAFLIGRKIASRGLPAVSFYTQPISWSFKKFKQEMVHNFKEDVLKEIKFFKKKLK